MMLRLLMAVPISITWKRSWVKNEQQVMAWLRLTITCRPPYLDDLRDLLEKFGTESISYSPASAEAVFGDAGPKDQFWELTSVSSLFAADLDLDILLACIRTRLGAENINDCRIEAVAEQDWLENHKSGLEPMVFANSLCICPSWCQRPGHIPHIVELDPGLAFGTGTHATTALCLDWLANRELSGQRVIDYGCGSGILAMAAAVLGAKSVTAVDIDQQALDATLNNMRQNGLQERIQVISPEDTGLAVADILIANILLKPLQELAPRFKSLLGEGGTLVLSGLLASQIEECLAVYRPWFEINKPLYRNEWAMLVGFRKQTK
jgi:ribosomal protein L11 methyltransferase